MALGHAAVGRDVGLWLIEITNDVHSECCRLNYIELNEKSTNQNLRDYPC